jgi:CheY-like chemotaxis protein
VKVSGANYDELAQKAELEFHDEATTRLAEMNRLLDDIAAKGAQDSYLADLLGHANNLRITGASFGFPAVTLIAQRLEGYLNDLPQWTDKAQRDAQEFCDALGDILERKSQPDDDEIAQLVRGLPSHISRTFSPGDVEIRNVEILLVTPARAVAKILSKQIMACGYRVNSVHDPIEGLTTALRLKPDMVITSQVMKGLTGVDLIRALKSVTTTEKIPCAVITSQELDSADFSRLPQGSPVLRSGSHFADDFAKVVTQLGLG